MYNQLCNTPSDINEHLPTLARLAGECESITEMGVRYCVSTFAFIEGKPKKLTCIDIVHPNSYHAQGGIESFRKVVELCAEKDIDFRFIEASTLDIEIEETDMLFIDTLHTGEHLRKELALHGNKAKKYLVFHDTVSCRDELVPVIQEFYDNNERWISYQEHSNNNGIIILSTC